MKEILKKNKIFNLFICLIFILLLTGIAKNVSAASFDTIPPVVSTDSAAQEYDLANYIEVLQDPKKEFTIESIFFPQISKGFTSYKDSKLSGKISNSAYWIRVVIENDEIHNKNMFLEISKPQLSDIQFYYFDGENLTQKIQTGSNYTFDKRPIQNRNFIFNLQLNPKERKTIILKVEAKSYLQLPIKLYSQQGFLQKQEMDNLALGFYYGIMLVMFLYNLILHFSLKDNSYIFYCFYILVFSLVQLVWDGLAFQYLWPNYPIWNMKSNSFLIILTGFFLLLFTRRFLSVDNRFKLFDQSILCFLSLQIMSLVIVLFIPVELAVKVAVSIATIDLLTCFFSIKIVGMKDKAVFLYVISWISTFIGSALNVLAAYKVLPLNFITLYSPRIGFSISIVLLSLSLGDRFNKIQQEKIIEGKQKSLLESLHGISKTITSTNDIFLMLNFLLKNILQITKYDNGMILLKENKEYIVKAVMGYNAEHLQNKVLLKVCDDINFKQIISEAKPVLSTFTNLNCYGIDRTFKYFIGFPVSYAERNVGAIILYSDITENSNRLQYEILYDFAGQVGIALENAKLFHQVQKMAITDGLTGIFNRTHFIKLSKELLEKQNDTLNLSLLMIDIDYFKKINDTYGHLMGDKVLKRLVSTVKLELNEDSIIGRYGGEEFLVLLKKSNLESAFGIAEKLRASCEELKIEIDNNNFISFTISIGISSINKQISNMEQLIERADEALYISKQNGRNQINAL